MKMLNLRTTGRVLLLGAIVGCAAAQAADPVTDALQVAYPPYRAALFQTNSKDAAQAQRAMQQAQQAWAELRAKVGTPGAPYAGDAAFQQSMDAVTQTYVKAEQQVKAQELGAAHETLEAVRDILSDLRRRNQVVVFSDHMNAYHEQMEHVLLKGAALLEQPHGMAQLAAQAGALEYLAKRLRAQAPTALSQNGEFSTLVDAVEQSVANLMTAVLAQDASAVKAAIGKIKAPYSKLFLKFG